MANLNADILLQHSGYLALGSACILSNSMAMMKFFKEAKNHQYAGQRPLLLAGMLADLFNGISFVSAGGSEIATRNWTTPTFVDNTTDFQWSSCMRTFYTPAMIFLQAFMSFVILLTSLDRLTAVATPVFYSQCIKPRHCYSCLGLSMAVCSAALISAYSSAYVESMEGVADQSIAQWSASSCFAPFDSHHFAVYFYGMISVLIGISIVIDFLGLISYTKTVRQRETYQAQPGNRNYIPRQAFAQTTITAPTGHTDHDQSITTSGGCSVPNIMCATIANVLIFFLGPCLFFWFTLSIENGPKTAHKLGPYVVWGFLIYSLINSMIFYMIRNDLRKSLTRILVKIRVRFCCMDPSGVTETTPVEVIAEPISTSTVSSLSNHSRMKKQRPSIVPLAYGTTGM